MTKLANKCDMVLISVYNQSSDSISRIKFKRQFQILARYYASVGNLELHNSFRAACRGRKP